MMTVSPRAAGVAAPIAVTVGILIGMAFSSLRGPLLWPGLLALAVTAVGLLLRHRYPWAHWMFWLAAGIALGALAWVVLGLVIAGAPASGRGGSE